MRRKASVKLLRDPALQRGLVVLLVKAEEEWQLFRPNIGGVKFWQSSVEASEIVLWGLFNVLKRSEPGVYFN